MKRLSALVCALFFAGCNGSSTTPSPVATASITDNLRDARYCEVIPTVASATSVVSYVYNTLDFNDCPADQWNALTVAQVDAEFGSQTAQLNGPRHWTIDALSASGATAAIQTFTFGGIETGLRATITTAPGEPTVGNAFYVPNDVARDTVWYYDAGQPLFELVAPNGDVYIMQSYAQIVDKTLSYAQLPALGGKLTLPAGWKYTTETLSTSLALPSNGLAHVVNDNFADSYQRR